MPMEATGSVMAVKETTELYELLLHHHPLNSLIPILNEIVPNVIHDLDPQVCPLSINGEKGLTILCSQTIWRVSI